MIDPRYCVQCKHLIGVRHDVKGHTFWKCGHPENIVKDEVNLVSGTHEKEFKTQTCVEARNLPESCGPGGKWFELYVADRYVPAKPSGPRDGGKSADDLLADLGL